MNRPMHRLPICTALVTLLAAGCGGYDYPDAPTPPAVVDAGASAPDAGEVGGDLSPDAGSAPVDDGYADTPDTSGTISAEWQARLAARTPDYGQALRTASLRLRGTLPTLVETRFVAAAGDPRRAYEAFIDAWLEEPTLRRQMLAFWRNTFRAGGNPALNEAPAFATWLVTEDRPITELFTATSGACATIAEDGTISPGDCDNGVPVHAGVLSTPGLMAHYRSNLAFRRVRFVQETFACTAFPAEIDAPMDVGGASPYTAPWPFESIAGADNGGRIDFHDVSSVTCANCHATMNHLAPLFARFDDEGRFQDDFAVRLPLVDAPLAVRADWLPPDEETGWRHGIAARNLPELGAALAADPDVEACFVARAWNFALGKGDIVATLSVVPTSVIETERAEFAAGGHRMKALLRAVFTSDDFTHF